jgi:hypothetical protein
MTCAMRFITILVCLGLIGGCADSNPVRPTPTSSPTSPPTPPPSDVPNPSISSISPTSAMVGSPDFTLKVTGTNFVQPSGPVGSWVIWSRSDPHGGTALRTTFVSTTELTAVVTAALLERSGTARIWVENGDIMGISDGFHGYPISNAVDFNVGPLASDAVLGVNRGIFAASPSCASAFPLAAREWTHTATLLPNVLVIGHYCTAADHRFRLVEVP